MPEEKTILEMQHPTATAQMPIFKGREGRLINYYVETEDLSRAASMCGIDMERAQGIMRRKHVRKEIERRLEEIHTEQAKLLAKHRNRITVAFLDDRLVTAIERGAARGDTRALELGYDRTGLRREGEFIVAVAPQGGGPARPAIYRAVERTVTRTESVTERVEGSEPADVPVLAAPPVVLDY